MIKINRPANIPSKLSKEGRGETTKHNAAYDNAPADYKQGKKTFDILNRIYGHGSVKSVLKKAQHNKCCFCEKDQIEEYGAVEHFRPKLGYKLTRKQKVLSKPNYYWLAYDWNNLFYVCSYCNGADNKGNLFPLSDETKRANSYHDDISKEDPYLINPEVINPRDHIYFKDHQVYGKTVYGDKTISICGLDRESLNVQRAEHLDDLKFRLYVLQQEAAFDAKIVDDARKYLKKAILPTAKFSAVAIDFLAQLNIQ